MRNRWILAIALLTAVSPQTGSARDASAQPKRRVDQHLILSSATFLASHPDLRWRVDGIRAYDEGRMERAVAYLTRAARFADKPAQALLAEMHWNGVGVPVDRVDAYIWMDLAAERGYLPFLATRERYWRALSAEEQAAARVRGGAAYNEFGDDVAKPRLEDVLRRARRNVAGSRVGSVGPLEIKFPGPDGQWHSVSADEFFQREYWQPDKYWAWQDALWRNPPQGNVIIREIERVELDD